MSHQQVVLGLLIAAIDYLSRHTYRSDVVDHLQQCVKLLTDDVPPVPPDEKSLPKGP